MDDYTDYDALGLADLVAKGETSPSELLEAALVRAEAAQDQLNCFSALFPEIGRAQIEAGLPEGPFKGVPFATKDLGVEIAGAPITNGSVACKGHVAARDTTLAARYRATGLVFFGQTTSPENGLTTTTESALYGQTRNPWDLSRTSGGSSGGASACVSSGVIPLAQASDGGGSIRIPAACTGLFGMKPSRGRIPMGPERTESWNGLSTIHAVSRSVRDNAALMDATAGPETGQRYHCPKPASSFLSALDRDPAPLRIGVWATAPNGVAPDPDAREGLEATMKLLEELGHIVDDADPGLDGDALEKGMLMVVSAHTAAFAAAREADLGRSLRDDELEPVTRRMVELGKTVPMVELVDADAAFQRAAITFESWMNTGRYDVVLSPTLSRKPDLLGTLSLSPTDFDAYAGAVQSFAPHCAAYNQMGLPAMSAPLHWTDDGIPIGMMFGARYGREDLLYALAGQLERAQPWSGKRPPVFVG